MRAREPDEKGVAEHNGVRVAYEVFGHAEPTLLLIGGWQWAYSRMWKAQVGYLARHYRVNTYDVPGNGRSDRPSERAAYKVEALAGYATAVLDATRTPKAVLVAVSAGAAPALLLAASTSARVEAVVLSGAGLPVTEPLPPYMARWCETIEGRTGWDKIHRGHMSEDFADAAQFIFEHMFVEPHSTKPIEDGVGWSRETTFAPLVAHHDGLGVGATIERARPVVEALARQVRCPVLLLHGSLDEMTPCAWSEWLAERFGWSMVRYEGSGHLPMARDPVRFNLDLRAFVDRASAGAAAHALDACALPTQACAVRILADRARSRTARYRHRRRAAAPAPGPRGRVAGAVARDADARTAQGAHSPGLALPGQRVETHRVRVIRARPARVPGAAPDGRDPGARTSTCSTTW